MVCGLVLHCTTYVYNKFMCRVVFEVVSQVYAESLTCFFMFGFFLNHLLITVVANPCVHYLISLA